MCHGYGVSMVEHSVVVVVVVVVVEKQRIVRREKRGMDL